MRKRIGEGRPWSDRLTSGRGLASGVALNTAVVPCRPSSPPLGTRPRNDEQRAGDEEERRGDVQGPITDVFVGNERVSPRLPAFPSIVRICWLTWLSWPRPPSLFPLLPGAQPPPTSPRPDQRSVFSCHSFSFLHVTHGSAGPNDLSAPLRHHFPSEFTSFPPPCLTSPSSHCGRREQECRHVLDSCIDTLSQTQAIPTTALCVCVTTRRQIVSYFQIFLSGLIGLGCAQESIW